MKTTGFGTRWISFLLAILLLLSAGLLCVGCGGTGDTGDNGDTEDTGDSADVGKTWIDYGTTVQKPTGTTRGNFDRSKFHIGTYCFYGDRSEDMMRAMSECGIDFIASDSTSRDELDLLRQYGIGVFASNIVSGWWGDNGQNAGQYEANHPMSMYENAAAGFVDHPAIYGVDIGDEPNLIDYPYIGQVAARVEELFPSQFPYLNLYPCGGSGDQLGGTAKQYYENYIRDVPTDYLCYDQYPYVGTINDWYANLRLTADLCTANDRSLWVVMQCFNGPVNGSGYGHTPYLAADQMRVQAYTAMAFGAELINWACWAKGWGSAFPAENGQLTEAYENLKTVNHEILGIADTYMRYRRVETWMLGFIPGTWEGRVLLGTDEVPYDLLPNVGVFENITLAEPGGNLVIGEMVPRNGDGSSALMIAEATEFGKKSTKNVDLIFSVADSRTVTAYCGDTAVELLPDADGVYHLHVEPSGGILLVAERK